MICVAIAKTKINFKNRVRGVILVVFVRLFGDLLEVWCGSGGTTSVVAVVSLANVGWWYGMVWCWCAIGGWWC
jgi:hypothetical protein